MVEGLEGESLVVLLVLDEEDVGALAIADFVQDSVLLVERFAEGEGLGVGGFGLGSDFFLCVIF